MIYQKICSNTSSPSDLQNLPMALCVPCRSHSNQAFANSADFHFPLDPSWQAELSGNKTHKLIKAPFGCLIPYIYLPAKFLACWLVCPLLHSGSQPQTIYNIIFPICLPLRWLLFPMSTMGIGFSVVSVVCLFEINSLPSSHKLLGSQIA